MKRIMTKKRVLLVVLSLLVLGLGFGFVFGNSIPHLDPSEEWENYIKQATFTKEKLEVENDGYQLEVELFIPEGGADIKPVVIFAGGSGSGIYQDYSGKFVTEVILEYFHGRDMAVVLYNKRGLGESEGNWHHNDFEGRADDVGAIIDVVKTHNKVDSSNIGVSGHSQGGWIAPLVASKRDDVAFWIAYAGPATSYEEQIEDLHETFYACDGLTEKEIESKIKLKLFITNIASRIGNVIPIGDIGFDAEIIDYDPADMLLELDVPGIFLFGENDPLVDPTRNANALERIFGDELPMQIEAIYIPSADHSFRVVDDMCVSFEESLQQQFAPELFEQLDLWFDTLNN